MSVAGAQPQTRVISGATGFVGSHFARSLLQNGERTHLLVRAPSEALALARVQAASEAARAATNALPSSDVTALVRPVCCDLLARGCALAASALADMGQHDVTEFWHFAASLRFEDRHRAQIFATNVDGTRRALALARELRCGSFIYVSTAYTAGRLSGSVPERLHGTRIAFNNYYEESKALAEHEVASYCAAHHMRYAILRPSIVIGPHSTKATGGTTTGLYGIAREVQRLSLVLRQRERRLEIAGDPETECNLMPVDWLVEDMLSLAREGLRDGAVYHLTAAPGLTIRDVGEVLAAVLDLPGLTIHAQPRVARFALEQQLQRRTSFYAGYYDSSKLFERARPFPRRVSRDELRQFIEVFVTEEAPQRVSAAGDPASVHG